MDGSPAVGGANTDGVALVAAPGSVALRTLSGREIRVRIVVDPILDLRASALTGHRIEARLLDPETGGELSATDRSRLLPRDWVRIDLACLDRGVNRLSSAASSDKPWLVLQVSLASLSNSGTRRLLLERAEAAGAEMKRCVIWELIDFQGGAHVEALGGVARLIRPLCRAVFVQIEPSANAVEAVRGAGVQGLTVRAMDLGQRERTIAESLRRIGQAVHGYVPTLTVTGLPSRTLLHDALAAGFSHASLRADEPKSGDTPA